MNVQQDLMAARLLSSHVVVVIGTTAGDVVTADMFPMRRNTFTREQLAGALRMAAVEVENGLPLDEAAHRVVARITPGHESARSAAEADHDRARTGRELPNKPDNENGA